MSFDIEVVRDSLRVFEQSILPAIQVTIRYKLTEDIIPLNISGSVYSVDNKFISNLTELPPIDVRNNKAPQHVEHGHTSKITHLTKETSAVPISDTYDLMFTLDKKTIDYIEERRYETKNHDVVFTFYLTLAVVRPSIRIGEFRSYNIQQNVSAVISSTDNPAESDPNFSILVLYDKDSDKYTLLFKKIIDVKTTYTIPSSTWVNDFQVRLGLGKFLIVEIPQFDVDLNSIDNASLSSDQKEFKDRLVKAIGLLADIEKDIREGEWGDAVKGCRDAIESLKKNSKQFIKEMVVKTTGVEQDNANQLTMALDNLYGYSSGLHHQTTTSNSYIGGKEDAYMTYMITNGIINSLARKFILIAKRRQSSSVT